MNAEAGLRRPRPSLLEWSARLISLVLAGLVTLSIIGSIAAIPSSSIGTRIGLERPERIPGPEVGEVEPRPIPAPAGTEERPAASQGGTGAAAAPPLEEELGNAEQWLEAITYALMALVGLAALAVLLLWRSVAERRRLADALELLASRRNAA